MRPTNNNTSTTAAARNLAFRSGATERPLGFSPTPHRDAGGQHFSAGRDARNGLRDLGSNPQGREDLSQALGGQQMQDRDLQEQLGLDQIMERLLLDPGFRPTIKRAPVATLADIKSGKAPGTALSKGVNAAYIPSKGVILVREGLSGEELKAAVKEEYGEWLGGQAEKAGLKLAPGDVGARVLKVLSGASLTQADFEKRPSDRTVVRFEGEFVEARSQLKEIVPKGKSVKQRVAFEKIAAGKPIPSSFHKAFWQPAGVSWGQLKNYGFNFAPDALSFQQKSLILQIMNANKPLTAQAMNGMIKKGWLTVTKANGTVKLNLNAVPNQTISAIYEATVNMAADKAPADLASPGYTASSLQTTGKATFDALKFGKAIRPLHTPVNHAVTNVTTQPMETKEFFDALQEKRFKFDDQNVLQDLLVKAPKSSGKPNIAPPKGPLPYDPKTERYLIVEKDVKPVRTLKPAPAVPVAKAVTGPQPVSVTFDAEMLGPYKGNHTDNTLIEYKEPITGQWTKLLRRGSKDRLSGPGSVTVPLKPGETVQLRFVNVSYGSAGISSGDDGFIKGNSGKRWGVYFVVDLKLDKAGNLNAGRGSQNGLTGVGWTTYPHVLTSKPGKSGALDFLDGGNIPAGGAAHGKFWEYQKATPDAQVRYLVNFKAAPAPAPAPDAKNRSLGQTIMDAVNVSSFGPQNFADAMSKTGLRFEDSGYSMTANDLGHLFGGIVNGRFTSDTINFLRDSGILKITGKIWTVDGTRLSRDLAVRGIKGILTNKTLSSSQTNDIIGRLLPKKGKALLQLDMQRYLSYALTSSNAIFEGKTVESIPKKNLNPDRAALRSRYRDGTEIETIVKRGGLSFESFDNLKTTISVPTGKKGEFDKIQYTAGDVINPSKFEVSSKSGATYELDETNEDPKIVKKKNGKIKTNYVVPQKGETYIPFGRIVDASWNAMPDFRLNPKLVSTKFTLTETKSAKDGHGIFDVKYETGETGTIRTDNPNSRLARWHARNLATLVGKLPPKARTFTLNKELRVTNLGFLVSGLAHHGGRIDVNSWMLAYPNFEKVMLGTLIHEIGHLVDNRDFDISRTYWDKAITNDGSSPSGYAKFGAKEDFAETFTLWFHVRHDHISAPKAKILEQRFKNRFALLDKSRIPSMLITASASKPATAPSKPGTPKQEL